MNDRRVLGLTFRQHIGGRWAISWVLYVINLPFNILATSTSIRSEPIGSQWWLWVAVALVGPVVIGLGFLIADITYLRHRRTKPVAIWVVAVTGLGIGVSRAAAVVALAAALGLQSLSVGDLVNRMLAGGLIGALVLPLGAFTLSCISQYRSERKRLEQERIDAERQVLKQEGELEALRETLVMGVRDQLQEAVADLTSTQVNPREVSHVIRGVSHDMWSAGDESPMRETRVRDVLWAAVRDQPLPVAAVSSLWAVSAAGSLIAALGVVVGIASLCLSTLSIAGCLFIANCWSQRHPKQWAMAVASMVLLAWVIVSPVSFLLFDPNPWQTALPVIVVNFFWLPAVTFIVTISTGALRSSEIVLANMENDVTAMEIRRHVIEQERESTIRELAAQVHGSAHSPMVVGAALMNHSFGDDEGNEWLVEQIGRAVAQISIAQNPGSLRESLAQVARPWTGLVDVRIDVDGSCVADVGEETIRTVDRIVDEGIANAFRHGNASVVTARVHVDQQRLDIEIRDNGCGVVGEQGAGLGTRLLDAAADSWSLTEEKGGGVLLHVVLPR